MNYFESLTSTDYFRAKTDAHRNFILKCLQLQTFALVPLLLSTKNRPFESMESILFQAAENNALKGITALCKALDLPKKTTLNPQRHAQLSTSLRANLETLSAAIPTVSSREEMSQIVEYGGHALRRDHLVLSTTRLCPHCVNETGYGRSYWILAPNAACEVHGIALVDHCDACESPISMSRPKFTICGCGANLLDSNVVNVSDGAQRISHLIGARFRSEAVVPDIQKLGFPEKELTSLPLGTLVDLITFLGTLHPNQKSVRMRKLKGPVSQRVAIAGLERAAHALSDWPRGFYAQLRRARAFFPQSESLDCVVRSLDHVMVLGLFSLPQKELSFITTEIGNFFSKPHEWNETRKHDHLLRAGR